MFLCLLQCMGPSTSAYPKPWIWLWLLSQCQQACVKVAELVLLSILGQSLLSHSPHQEGYRRGEAAHRLDVRHKYFPWEGQGSFYPVDGTSGRHNGCGILSLGEQQKPTRSHRELWFSEMYGAITLQPHEATITKAGLEPGLAFKPDCLSAHCCACLLLAWGHVQVPRSSLFSTGQPYLCHLGSKAHTRFSWALGNRELLVWANL